MNFYKNWRKQMLMKIVVKKYSYHYYENWHKNWPALCLMKTSRSWWRDSLFVVEGFYFWSFNFFILKTLLYTVKYCLFGINWNLQCSVCRADIRFFSKMAYFEFEEVNYGFITTLYNKKCYSKFWGVPKCIWDSHFGL